MATTPYPFVSGAVLLASELNSTFNIPTSTKTDSYTLVATDAGKRIIMNKATSTTITVNTSLFAASDVVEILNIGAGTCTITAGTATVSTTGSLALAQNGSGRLVFTSASASFFEQAAVADSGLVLISSASFSAVSSFSLSANTFTATYTNYQIFINTDSSASSEVFSMRLRASGTDNSSANYAWVQYGWEENAGAVGRDSGAPLQTSFQLPAVSGTYTSQMQITLMAPNDTNFNTGFNATGFYYDSSTNFSGINAHGVLSVTTAYDSATFIVASGTVTGSYSVYGMAK